MHQTSNQLRAWPPSSSTQTSPKSHSATTAAFFKWGARLSPLRTYSVLLNSRLESNKEKLLGQENTSVPNTFPQNIEAVSTVWVFNLNTGRNESLAVLLRPARGRAALLPPPSSNGVRACLLCGIVQYHSSLGWRVIKNSYSVKKMLHLPTQNTEAMVTFVWVFNLNNWRDEVLPVLLRPA